MDLTESLILPTQNELNDIYQELNTSEDKIEADVKTIVEWMHKQPHFRGIQVNERRIWLYLILCKNSLERTKETFDKYYSIKSMVPEYFGHRDPTSQSLQKSMNTAFFIPLPKPTAEGYRVSLSRLRSPKVENYVFSDYIKVGFMSLDVRMSKLDTFKKEVFIFDLDKYSISHLPLMLPELKKMIYCVATAYPLRIHQVHVINMPSFAQSAFNLIMGFLKKKIAQRIMIHNSVEDLKKYVNPDILPLDYGGTYPKTSEEMSETWKEELIKQRDWFLSQNSDVSDETKRIQKHNVDTDMLTGIEGSFRRLEVD